jgi:hypothetical protein
VRLYNSWNEIQLTCMHNELARVSLAKSDQFLPFEDDSSFRIYWCNSKKEMRRNKLIYYHINSILTNLWRWKFFPPSRASRRGRHLRFRCCDVTSCVPHGSLKQFRDALARIRKMTFLQFLEAHWSQVYIYWSILKVLKCWLSCRSKIVQLTARVNL